MTPGRPAPDPLPRLSLPRPHPAAATYLFWPQSISSPPGESNRRGATDTDTNDAFSRNLLLAASLAVLSVVSAENASAARIANPVAVFAGIDKITGRITTFDVYVNETVQYGALQVTPKVCYSRDDTEAQKIDGFVEVDEITLDRKIRRIFTGWMFADSPGLNAVEHPIYDVWLTGCKASSDVPPPASAVKQ